MRADCFNSKRTTVAGRSSSRTRRQKRSEREARQRAAEELRERVIKMHVHADIGTVTVIIGTLIKVKVIQAIASGSSKAVVSLVDIYGMAADVKMKTATTVIDASMRAITIQDHTPPACHTQVRSTLNACSRQVTGKKHFALIPGRVF